MEKRMETTCGEQGLLQGSLRSLRTRGTTIGSPFLRVHYRGWRTSFHILLRTVLVVIVVIIVTMARISKIAIFVILGYLR